MKLVRALILLFTIGAARPVLANSEQVTPEADFRQFKDWAWFLLGAGAGYVAHEMGHMFTDFMFGKHVDFVETHLGKVPFFAIQPCCNLTNQQLYVIASAGFMTQDVSSELILWISPRIRSQRHAFLKGVLALDIGLSLGYAISGFLPNRYVPAQSDVASMSRALGVPPWQVGLMLLVPAMVDTYRYLVPSSVWAPWVGVQSKLLMFGASFAF